MDFFKRLKGGKQPGQPNRPYGGSFVQPSGGTGSFIGAAGHASAVGDASFSGAAPNTISFNKEAILSQSTGPVAI